MRLRGGGDFATGCIKFIIITIFVVFIIFGIIYELII